jgi:hypothetical protein
MNKLSYALTGDTELLPLLLCCTASAFLVWAVFRYGPEWKRKKAAAVPAAGSALSWQKKSRQFRPYKRKDWFWMTLITVVYAVVSFWQLGGTKLPSTTWQPVSDSQFIILQLTEDTHFDAVYAIYGEGDNNSNLDAYQLGFHKIQITGSNDKTNWTHIAYLDGGSIYQYLITKGDWDYKYIGIVSTSRNDTISEIGFKAAGEDRFLKAAVDTDSAAGSAYPASLVIDEQDKLQVYPTYMDESYFDEIYHPRNAWEIANGEYMYASVHPLLGTSLIALSIRLFGMNPLAWRLPGAVFGVLLVPLFYAVAKLLFQKTEYAALGAALYASDFMHLTTSRIATLEPFSVFWILLMFYFMIRYYYSSFYDTSFLKQMKLLLLCGITMGLGIATKWTACYSAIGLAILLFTNLGQRTSEFIRAKKELRKPDLSPAEKEACEHIRRVYPDAMIRTILWCCVFFLLIPAVIYDVSYMWTMVWRDGWSTQNVITQILYMYNYHTNLKATHPYQSVWYQWLLDIQPIWYYVGKDASGYVHTISCFSNPLIVWMGDVACGYAVYDVLKHRNSESFIISVGFLTALVPWVLLVKRCIFAYHFYPSSLFMILALAGLARHLIEEKSVRYRTYVMVYAIACIAVFFFFLPATAGFGTTYDFVHRFLLWLPSWYFGA